MQIYGHSGGGNIAHSPTLKLLLQNNDSSEVRMTAGTFVVEAVILSIIHPTLNFENGSPAYPRVEKEKDEVQAMHIQMDDISHCKWMNWTHPKYLTATAQRAVT